MNNSRNRIASRGSGRLKPQTPSELSRSTKLPQISTSLASTEESNMSFWSPSRPPGYSVGVCSQQGKRPYQEDQFAIKQFVNTLLSGKTIAAETHMFGLFDGHAGGRCSTHLAGNLANTLVEEDSFLANLPLALKRSFYTVNEQFLKIAEKNKWHDGSTGNVAVIRDGKLTVANVGDCRALLISNGRALQMSNDHKPTNPDEQKRIASLGGAVVYCMGVARVNKVLAVSRAFGNRTLRQVIRPDAELMQRELVPGDDFLVMASDGLWDVLRNKDVCDVCYSSYLGRRPQAIADELVNMALARGSMDNVTCIVVNLADYRPPLPGNSLNEFNNPLEEAFSRNSGSSANTPSHHRSLNISYGLQTESIADSQQLYEDDNGTATAMSSSSMQYSLNITRVRTAGNSSNNNNSSHNNNNFYPAHEMPSKQRSLGTINPRDLPTLSSDSDPFGLKTLAQNNNNNNASISNNNARVPFMKAVSTNSMSSQENFADNGGNSTSFANLEKMPNPANGFLRPLTAIDAAPLPGNHNSNSHSSSNSSKVSLRNQSMASDATTNIASLNTTNNSGNNGNLSSSINNSSSFNSNKLAQIRAIKNATSSSTSSSPFDVQSQSQPQPQPFQSQRALLSSRQNNVYNQSNNNGNIMNNSNNRMNLY